jgi:hypothetical protein
MVLHNIYLDNSEKCPFYCSIASLCLGANGGAGSEGCEGEHLDGTRLHWHLQYPAQFSLQCASSALRGGDKSLSHRAQVRHKIHLDNWIFDLWSLMQRTLIRRRGCRVRVSIRRQRSCIGICSMHTNCLHTSYCDALLLCSGISVESSYQIAESSQSENAKRSTHPHPKMLEIWGGEAQHVVWRPGLNRNHWAHF